MIRRLLVILLLAASMQACEIPFGWFITAPDPCRVIDDMRAIWPEVEARRWFTAWSQGKSFTPMTLEELGMVTIVEEPGAFGPDKNLAGTFEAGWGWPTIHFTRAYPEIHALQHEVTHWAYWKLNPSGGEFMNIGHGTPDDQFALAINAWVDRLWAVTKNHSYFPGYLPIPHVIGAAACRVTRSQLQ